MTQNAILKDMKERVHAARQERPCLGFMLEDHTTFDIPMSTEEETLELVRKTFAKYPGGMIFLKNKESKEGDPLINSMEMRRWFGVPKVWDKEIVTWVGLVFGSLAKCTKCKKILKTPWGLAAHMRKTHGEKHDRTDRGPDSLR